MEKQYLDILGLQPGYTVETLKKAYLEKTKFFHPNNNKASETLDDFILITEAYDYLLNKKTGKIYDSDKGKFIRKKKYFYGDFEEWSEERREIAKRRAIYYASKPYVDFTSSDFYYAIKSINSIFDFISLLLAIALFPGVPIFGYLNDLEFGFYYGLFISFITAGVWVKGYLNLRFLRISDLIDSFKTLFGTKSFLLGLVIILNLYVMFRIVKFTLLPLYFSYGIILILTSFALVHSLRNPKITSAFKKALVPIVVATLINSFFTINYLLSHHPNEESYYFTREFEGKHSTSLINLKGNKYHEYIGIRYFFDYDTIRKSNYITYHFANGLFGIRVLKSYELKMVGHI